jgi:UDPglucose 6-dehydrogenase
MVKYVINIKAAETFKLFHDAYLAMRVSFFNELDTYCKETNISDYDIDFIISLLGEDYRIGDYYNNPSFGYNGLYLPTAVKQISNKSDQCKLIKSIENSNSNRLSYIRDDIIEKYPSVKIIGIYRLLDNRDSNTAFDSSSIKLIEMLKSADYKIKIYAPTESEYLPKDKDYDIINDLEVFVNDVDLIVANRIDNKLMMINRSKPIYTRDLLIENDYINNNKEEEDD